MPFVNKKKCQRKERAAAMGRNNKKSNTDNISVVAAGKSSVEKLTCSSKICIATSNEKNIKVIDNHSRTIDDKVNTKCLQREIASLKKEFCDQRSLYDSSSYSRKDSGNRIIHWDSLKSLVESNARCFECGRNLILTEATTGLATEVLLTCQNSGCKLKHKNKVKKTKVKEHKFRSDSAESFAINCQFVISLLQTGCGSTEAETTMTYLDLPNGPSFRTKTFAKIQDAIWPIIKNISDTCMKDEQNDKIKETLGENMYEEQFLQKKLIPAQVPLTVMYDMGWNK